eukprot:919342-Pyramimonas_sp.AAC.1
MGAGGEHGARAAVPSPPRQTRQVRHGGGHAALSRLRALRPRRLQRGEAPPIRLPPLVPYSHHP